MIVRGGVAAVEAPVVSFSFLTTEEDYCCYRLDCAKLSCGKRDRTALTLIGIAMILGGTAGAALFSHHFLNYIAWGLCIVTGFFAAGYFSLFEPLLVARRAQKEYAKIRSKLSAQTVELCETGVHIRNDRCDGFYPYEILHRCIRTEHFFLLFFGVGDSVAVALRTAKPEELEQASALLQRQLKGKYIDRSA